MNRELAATAKEIKERYSFALCDNSKSLSDFIKKKQVMVRKGSLWSLQGHHFQKEILAALDDEHPHLVVEKAAQVGISTLFLIESMYLAEKYSAKSLYYFPTDTDVADFSIDRADRIIDATPKLQDLNGGISNVHLKHIGGGALYFRGLWSKRKVKSVDGDVLYLDELDEADPENVEYAKDRLLHSQFGYIRQLSQPSVPDFGIDAQFKKGTQEHYYLKCPVCGHWQCLELNLEDGRFPKNFRKIPKKWRGGRFPKNQVYYRACLKCGSELDMNKGEMVPKHPGRPIRSFKLSQLYSQISQKDSSVEDRIMTALLDAKSSFQIARVVNSIIGSAYVDGNLQPLNDTVLEKATGNYGLQTQGTYSFMGVDQGDTLTISIGESEYLRLRTTYLEETGDWSRLYRLMDQFDVAHCVIDAMPNKSDAKRFAAAFPGRVTIQYFSGNFRQKEEPFVDNNIEAEIPAMLVDRDESLDDTVYMIKTQDLLLPKPDIPVVEDCRRHLKNLYKEKNERTGKTGYKKKVENHYGMAINSMRLAMLHCPSVPYTGVLPTGGKLR